VRVTERERGKKRDISWIYERDRERQRQRKGERETEIERKT
jgi:hypothetical protein